MTQPPDASSPSLGSAARTDPPPSGRIASEFPLPHASEPPSGAFQGEDFLFHLYRGSELLQDNCVAEAKEELERALGMQPRDVEGQGLLGVVYFRLGMYPQAIRIYEELTRACPLEATPALNLALCYFKTGQLGRAQETLEEVLRLAPDHTRAWGYLGLIFQRHQEFAKARAAFDRARQPQLARRMQAALEAGSEQGEAAVAEDIPRADLREAVHAAAEQLERDPPRFLQAEEPEDDGTPSGRWTAFEPGHEPVPSVHGVNPFRGGTRVPDVPTSLPPPASVRPTMPTQRNDGANHLEQLGAERRLHCADGNTAASFGHHWLVLAPRRGYVVRKRALQAATGPTFELVQAELPPRPDDLGTSPWLRISGAEQLVLCPEDDARLAAIQLSNQQLLLRRDRLIGFDASLQESADPLPDLAQGPFVQLTGSGTVVVSITSDLRTLSVLPGRSTAIEPTCVVGWWGRFTTIGFEEGRAHGELAEFRGQGSVLVDASTAEEKRRTPP